MYSKSLQKGYRFTYNSMCDKIGNPQVGKNEILLLRVAKEVINKCHQEELTSKANGSQKTV